MSGIRADRDVAFGDSLRSAQLIELPLYPPLLSACSLHFHDSSVGGAGGSLDRVVPSWVHIGNLTLQKLAMYELPSLVPGAREIDL